MTLDLETMARTLRQYQNEYSVNINLIHDMQARNEQINIGIRSIYERIKNEPLTFTDVTNKEGRIIGELCWHCSRFADVRCFWCFVNEKPCGYCKNHLHLHKKEFPDHNAIFQHIDKPEPATYTPKPKLTPEQEKADLLRRLAELDKELSA